MRAVESSTPDPRLHLGTRGCGQQCLGPRVLAQGLSGAAGVRSWTFQCVKELARTRGARRTGTRSLSSRSSSGRSTQPPQPRPLPRGHSDTWRRCGIHVPPVAAAPGQRQRPPTELPGCGLLWFPPPGLGPEPILVPPELGQQMTRGFLLLLPSMPHLYTSF